MSRDVAYRGFLIRSNMLGDLWVEKDGVCICHATSEEEARRAIDRLLD